MVPSFVIVLIRFGDERAGAMSGDGGKVFDDALEHLLVETSDGIFGEVRGGSMILGCSLVAILFVDQDGVGTALDKVGYVIDASVLLPREAGELAEDSNDLLTIIGAERHTYGEADHYESFADVRAGRSR
jgi:hypothetical protein